MFPILLILVNVPHELNIKCVFHYYSLSNGSSFFIVFFRCPIYLLTFLAFCFIFLKFLNIQVFCCSACWFLFCSTSFRSFLSYKHRGYLLRDGYLWVGSEGPWPSRSSPLPFGFSKASPGITSMPPAVSFAFYSACVGAGGGRFIAHALRFRFYPSKWLQQPRGKQLENKSLM